MNTNPERIDVDQPHGASLPKRVSYSQMALYQQCALKYYFSYLAGWKEPPTSALANGTITHEIVEHLYRLPPHERTLEKAVELLREHGPILLRKPEFQAFENDNALKASIRTAVENLFKLESPHELSVDPAHLEMELNVEINGVQFTGKVDRFTNDEIARVTDYKTGRSPGRFIDDKLAQPYLYALAFKLQHDIDVEQLELIYLHAQEVVRRDVDSAVMVSMGEKLAIMSSQSQKDFEESTWNAQIQRLCDFCAFQPVCPARNPSAPKPGSPESDSKLRSLGLVQRLRIS